MKVLAMFEDRRLSLRASTLPRCLRRAARLLGVAGELRAVSFLRRGCVMADFTGGTLAVVVLDRR